MSTPAKSKHRRVEKRGTEQLEIRASTGNVVGDKIMLARVLMKKARTCRCITTTTSR